MSELLSITACYKTDREDAGICFQWTREISTKPLEEVMDELMAVCQSTWDQACIEGKKDELASELFDELEYLSRDENFDFEKTVIVIGNLWLLERYGYLAPDDCNGLLFQTDGDPYEAVPPEERRP